MTLEARVRATAIQEVVQPTFGVTEQLLAVHTIPTGQGQPCIADVEMRDGEARVYFSLDNEAYYLLIYLDLVPDVQVRCVEISAATSVRLVVRSETHPLALLLSLITFHPTTQWDKGQPRVICGRQLSSLNSNSGFYYQVSGKKTGEVEAKLRQLVDNLIPRKVELQRLVEIAEVDISVGYHGYAFWMGGIHLENAAMQALAELPVSLDMDLYANGPDLPA